MLIIPEGSLNKCRLSCPILDEKEATKEEEPSKPLLRVINQFPMKFFIKTVGAGHPPNPRFLRIKKEAQEAREA